MENKEKLIDEYVNLYRLLWGNNAGLWTEDLKNMSAKELKKDIKDMEMAIKDKNSYFPMLKAD